MAYKKEQLKAVLTYVFGFVVGAAAIKICYDCGYFKA